MSTEATVFIIAAAILFAAYMTVSSMRITRLERAEAARARARAEQARLEVEIARRRRLDWEQRLADQRDAILVGGDPRGLGDGLGRVIEASNRFRRVPAHEAAEA